MESLQVISEQEVLGRVMMVYGTNENPLILARDVADWINHNQVARMIEVVDEDEKLKCLLSTSGQNREMWFLTENGVYEVLMQSRKSVAKEWKREVKKVLKQIRLTGGYIPHSETDSEADIMAKALLIAHKTIERKEQQLSEKQKVIEYQEPLVALAENRIDKKGCFSITDATKSLGLKRGNITRWAKEEGYLHKTLTEVNKSGEEYFKVYSTDGKHNAIGITEAGLRLIKDHIEEVRLS